MESNAIWQQRLSSSLNPKLTVSSEVKNLLLRDLGIQWAKDIDMASNYKR